MSNSPTGTAYQQLTDTLRKLIKSGDYHEGDQFLSEREIAKQYEVSRVTASKAVSRLVSEGALEIRKGAGTFIRTDMLDYDLKQLVSFTEKAVASGKVPETKLLFFERSLAEKIPAKVKSSLHLSDDSEVYYLERLRLADDTPVIYERRYITAAYCPDLTDSLVDNSLYSTWTDHYQLDIIGADEVIRAINLSSKQAELLDVLPQTAALLVCSTGFLSNQNPLWWEETIYRTDIYEFRNRLGGIKTSYPAVGQFKK